MMREKDRLFKNVRLNIGYCLINVDGQPFQNKTALSRAQKKKQPQFSNGMKRCAPQNGDYTIVMADGTCKKIDGKYPITRYGFYNDKWVFQYIIGYPQDMERK